MSSAEESAQPEPLIENTPKQLLLSDLVKLPWARRFWLMKITACGLVLGAVVAILLPNQYQSTAELMPPDQQSINSTSLLGALSGMGAASMLPSGGGLLSVRTPGQTAIGILSSRTAQDDIVNKLNLLKVYHAKYYADARAALKARTTFDEDKKSGIVSITFVDHDKYLAHDIVQAYIEELDKLLNAENTSSAHRERVFLEERLQTLKMNLDATSTKLSEFSSHNATLSPQVQGQALLETAGKLQAELITAESELDALKTQYSADNVRVRAATARVSELQSHLRKMGGMGEKDNSSNLQSDELQPSIRQLPLLGATYSDLLRQVATQEGVYETLTKQYELAKVQEVKEFPQIKVLDAPDVAEKKTSPHRTTIAIFAALLALIGGVIWILGPVLWNHVEPEQNKIAA